ncbi:MAG TPA: nuclear transport factor 2 family protein [Solirubrobacteraceae bacterium]|jgi:ketosteroid isomerase-like protein|nr:nuclear transport factor 2 family protein [Solirubrobacteraceae bacterium]
MLPSSDTAHASRVHARVSRPSRRQDARAHAEARHRHDNVQAIVEAYADYNRGDGNPSPDYWHEDAEYRTAPEDPDSGIHRGLDAIARLFASWREVYPNLQVEVHEARARRNRVFAWVRFVGRGAASGVPIHMELAHVATMRDGKTLRLVEYNDRAEALRAMAD